MGATSHVNGSGTIKAWSMLGDHAGTETRALLYGPVTN
jgi:hypothetical protein